MALPLERKHTKCHFGMLAETTDAVDRIGRIVSNYTKSPDLVTMINMIKVSVIL